MEEEETKINRENYGRKSEMREERDCVNNSAGIPETAHIEAEADNVDSFNSGIDLGVHLDFQDDHFEPVLLSDQGNDKYMNQSPNQSEFKESSVRSDDAFESSLATVESSKLDSPSYEDLLRDHSYAASLDSSFQEFGYNGYSPSESPQRVKSKQVLSNVSPELLHLVDSAIMGKVEILEKLKKIVSGVENFGEGNDAVSMAYVVVDSLLATMGGVESFEEDDEDNPPTVMLNSRAAIVAGELIPWLPDFGDFQGLMSPRTRMVKGLLAILRACTRNRAMCSAAGLLGALLRSAERIFVLDMGSMDMVTWDASPLCHCIQHLAGHSLSPRDLHQWLQVVSKASSTVWATRLLNSLEKAMSGEEVRGPANTFEFDGECSGLLGPGDSKWPFANGYAFATWIYIESFADNISTATTAAAIAMAAAATSGKSSHMSAAAAASALAGEGTAHMPRLFSFLTADNQGMEAYFHAQFLVVESGSGKGKKASLHFTYAFKPQCWYFIGLEHINKQGLLGKSESELRLYVDGSLYETRPFDFPRISKPLAFCCIGTNPPPTMAGLQRRRRQCPLFAEMGPVYIFKEPIGPEKMGRLACRGGDVLPSFGDAAGYPWLATNDHVKSTVQNSASLDIEISGCLHLLYHPCLLAGRYCPDASPSGSSGMVRRPAEVLGQVRVAARMRPAEALWSLAYGGPICLLPLVVGHVSEHSLEPYCGDPSVYSATTALAAPVFRLISLAIKHPGNNEEFHSRRGSEILSRVLSYLLHNLSSLDLGKCDEDEDLISAIVSLCQSQKFNHILKVQLFSTLLLDLKTWSLCSYGLQKKLFSSLADMVFTESSVMRDANAIQMLLDGCRRCYWTIRENDSVNTFSARDDILVVGEVNSLVDELLVVIELLIVAAPLSLATDDIRCLLGFMVDCPQPNQVARVLHLIYRLVVQPNVSRARTFAEAFISCGGIETLLVLLQRETNAGDCSESESKEDDEAVFLAIKKADVVEGSTAELDNSDEKSFEDKDVKNESLCLPENFSYPLTSSNEVKPFVSENDILGKLGGISHSISAENAWNNVYNIDKSDGIVVGIINLLGALMISGHLKCDAPATPDVSHNLLSLLDGGGTMFDDKVSLLLFGLQKALQAAPKRLLSIRVYTVLLAASLNVSPADDGLNFYDSVHRFEHFQILLVLLRSLPFASASLQTRALQDLLILACHPENRSSLTGMDEWPEWILEILISNHEAGGSKSVNGPSLRDVEDFIHNFLIIMLQHSIREKDGWKDIEAAIHCAEWLSMVGGSSTGDVRIRREESLPVFKRRLLGDLLDFAARELQAQTQVIAAAAAGVAAVGLPPKDAKVEAEKSAEVSVFLVENAIVILMLVEDHLRLQSKIYAASRMPSVAASPLSNIPPTSSSMSAETPERTSRYSSGDSQGLPLNVFAGMADGNGQIPTVVMERLAASAAAEPYESVFCAFVSYGSCVIDLAEGWKYRSRLWYGVGFPPTGSVFGGGGSGWDSWKSALEKDSSGSWIELPLIMKSVAMLHALLLDDSGLGGGLGIGGGSGTGMGGMSVLYHLLDSDQPFLCMLRMVLVSLREDDDIGSHMLLRHSGTDEQSVDDFRRQSSTAVFDANSRLPSRKPKSALLWSVLSPILNMPISETKRQRVLVASCVLYSEVWSAIGKDRSPLRKHYLEAILPPFVAILRRWRPLLAGIHELATADGINPLVVDDRALAADTLPVEAALSIISPNWAASFASPPAAMALAMIAAGAAGGETSAPRTITQLRRDSSLLERKAAKLQTFSSFQKPLEVPTKPSSIPKDKAAAKAAALAAARDLERNAKIGSGRGLSAVAMATSAQRRSKSDAERVKRWNLSEAMGTAWMECLQTVDSKSVYGKDLNALSYKYMAVLVGSLALARNMQRSEVDRRSQADIIAQNRSSTGMREWRRLIHSLVEMKCLFAPFSDVLYNPKRVFWKLDFKENSSRMRRILRRNYRGSYHAGAAANYDDHVDHKYDDHDAVSSSKASAIVSEAISTEAGNEQDEHDVYSDTYSSAEQPSERLEMKSEQDVQPVISAESGDPSMKNNLDSAPNPEAVARGTVPNEHDERIVLELPSSMVRPLKVLKGIFQITTKRINFIIDTVDSDAIKNVANGDTERDRSWVISSLHQVYSRRYLLSRSALELFMVDRSNHFFDFGTTEGRRNAYRAIVHARPPYLNDIYLATQRPEQLLKRTQLMERWSRREISNFEYLMQLNTLSGRSYNDITQYPVFPWILSDYSSQNLDLSKPSSFRDLSKPIGALNDERLQKFQERYSSFDDPVIPKFLYGSHYSTAGTVLYYLSRVEPFTTLSIQLQGGKFDHADRMFSDIAATWNGVLEDMSDVKELVPELFYMPEVLTNENSIDFGTTQLGEKIDSVRLPPWAENSVDFVHKHRMALESEYVSEHLHEWIDLIFGYKQRGKDAIEANNVFFYITYEGTVDIDKISDPVQRRAAQDQIAYFGQTPSQLLTVPHIKRMPLSDVLSMQTIFRNPQRFEPYIIPYPERCNLPASAIRASSDSIILVDLNAPAAHIAQHKWQPNTPDGLGNPFIFHHGKPGMGAGSGGFIRIFKGPAVTGSEEWQFPQALAYATSGIRSTGISSITCTNEIITGGHVDSSIRLISADGAKTLEIAMGHCAPVTCLALSTDSSYLVTGSRDATVLLWRIHRFSSSRPSSSQELSVNPNSPTSTVSGLSSLLDKSRRSKIEGPLHVLRGHLGEVTCCAVSSDLGIVASCSFASDVLLHSVRQGKLIRRLVGVEAHCLCLSSDGIIVSWNKHLNILSTFTLNGNLIAEKRLPFSSCISCLEVSVDGQSAVVGLNPCLENDRGFSSSENLKPTSEDSNNEPNHDEELDLPLPSVCLFDLYTLKVFHTFNLKEGHDITAIALNTDNTNLLVSTDNKQLIVFSDPSVKY